MSDVLGWTGQDGRLARLRRLYHHVINGGRTSLWNERDVGGPVTAESIAKAIIRLEAAQCVEHHLPLSHSAGSSALILR